MESTNTANDNNDIVLTQVSGSYRNYFIYVINRYFMISEFINHCNLVQRIRLLLKFLADKPQQRLYIKRLMQAQ